jgi:hypothetical protein
MERTTGAEDIDGQVDELDTPDWYEIPFEGLDGRASLPVVAAIISGPLDLPSAAKTTRLVGAGGRAVVQPPGLGKCWR